MILTDWLQIDANTWANPQTGATVVRTPATGKIMLTAGTRTIDVTNVPIIATLFPPNMGPNPIIREHARKQSRENADVSNGGIPDG